MPDRCHAVPGGCHGRCSYSELSSGVPSLRETGVEHDGVNANEHDFWFLEIELMR